MALLGVGLSLFAAQAAFAQQPAPAEEKKEEAVKLETFEVTGSRIKRVDFEGPSPIRVINRQAIEASGRSNLTELMRELPEAGAIGINEGGTISAVRGSTALNLRALGANNTLVIVNGRRQVLTGSNSGGTTFVDLNRFPLAMIERIEILKDGASAIYGADATAGVINIITRKDFTGFELSTSYGNNFKNDTGEKSIALTGGASNGKASINVGVTYFERGALTANENDFSNNADLTARYLAKDPVTFAADPVGFFDLRSGTGPQARVTIRSGQVNGVNGVNIPGVPIGTSLTRLPGTGGVVPSGGGALLGTLASATPSFTVPFSAGTGGQFNAAAAATYEAQRLTPGQAVSNLFNFQPFVWLVPAAERTGMYSDFNYRLSDTMSAYMSVSYQHNHTRTKLAPSPISTAGDNQIFVPKENFYNPFGVDLNFNYRATELGPRIADITSNTYSILAGVKGTLMDKFDWDIGYTYGHDETVDVGSSGVSESRLRAALARTDATALNIFGGPNFRNNADTLKSVLISSQKGGSADLNLFDAKISGPLFPLPMGMGDLKGAIYTEYRQENFAEANDAVSTTLDDVIGQVKLADSTRAYRNVESIAAEIGLPLVKANTIPFIFSLDLSAAARYEKFSDGYNSGTKPYVGLRYQPVKALLLRGSYTQAFRAPTLPQLFGGVRESLPSGLVDFARPQALTGDPFDGASTQRLVRAGGNKNLTPETAKSFTAGFVWDVPYKYFKGLTIDATYGEIEQTNIISTTGTTFVRNNEFGDARGLITRASGTQTFTNTTASPITVYTGPGARLSPGADTIVLPGQSITVPGQILSISNSVVNLAFQRVRYLDVAAHYTIKTTNWGRFSADSALTYLREYTFTRTVGSPLQNFVDFDGLPRFRIQSHIGWKLKEWSAELTNNYLPSYGKLDSDGFRVDNYSTYNAQVSYLFPSKGLMAGVRLSVNLDNVFDTKPPLYRDAVGYDQSFIGRPQGRFASISLKKEF